METLMLCSPYLFSYSIIYMICQPTAYLIEALTRKQSLYSSWTQLEESLLDAGLQFVPQMCIYIVWGTATTMWYYTAKNM